MFGKSEARQRSVPRTKSERVASLSAGGKKHFLTLIDVSRTGGRLSGVEFPDNGQQVLFRAKDVEVFAKVVWSAPNECAVEFTTPISPAEVQRLQA